jgi:hypothetical protein
VIHRIPTEALITDERDAEQTMIFIFATYPNCIKTMLGLINAKALGETLKGIMSPEALAELKEGLE